MAEMEVNAERLSKTGAIDDMHRAVGKVPASDEDRIKDGKVIVEKLAVLKYELQHNRQMLYVVMQNYEINTFTFDGITR
jgi:hypothetical protein